MREVFQKVGVQIPDQVFQDLWQEAERRDPHGEVRVHTPLVSIEYDVCVVYRTKFCRLYRMCRLGSVLM